MTTAQRFLSLSLLSGMALTLAPLASAASPADLSDEDRRAVRSALEACRDTNDEHEARRSCAEGVFSQYGIERPVKHRRARNNIPEEAR